MYYNCIKQFLFHFWTQMHLWSWLDHNEKQLMSLLTFGLAAATIWLVIETRKLSEIDHRPWFFISQIFFSPDNGRLNCTFKNPGKIPVTYKVIHFSAVVDKSRIFAPIMHNNGRDVFQGESENFTFGFMQSADFVRLRQNIDQMLNNNQMPQMIEGRLEVVFEYFRFNKRHKEVVSKKYLLEINTNTLTDTGSGKAIFAGFQTLMFEQQ